MESIAQFSDKNQSLNSVGGKGLNLVKLSLQNFNVPTGFILTTNSYIEFINYNNLQNRINQYLQEIHLAKVGNIEQISTEIRKIIELGILPPELQDELGENLLNNQNKHFAVRSSATAEDLPDYSFAGLHDTILNVKGLDQIVEAVKKCFSSLWTTRAIEYRLKNNIEQQNIAIAVVIQEQIQSEVSGVLFTADPVTNNHKNMIIESTYGLGEAIVSGMVNPDHFLVDYDGSILNQKIGSKRIKIISSPDGGTREITENNMKKVTLTKKNIKELVKLGKAVQDFYSSPQDIEWAFAEGKLYLLQSRAITTLYKIEEEILQEKRLEAFMSFNMVQGIMEPITPLGGDTINEMIKSISPYLGGPKDPKVLYTTSDRLWIKFTLALENKIFFNIGTKGFLALAEPESRKIFLYLNRKKIFKIKGGLPSLRKGKKLLRFFLSFFSAMRKNIEDPVARRQLVFTETEKKIDFLTSKSSSLTEIKQMLQFNQWVCSHMFPYFIIKQAPYVGSGLGMPFFAIKKLASSVEGGDDLVASLVSDIPYNVTSDMNRWTWELVKPLKQEPEIVKLFEEKSYLEISKLFLENQLPSKLQLSIQQFIDKYGFRGYNELDLGRQRWNEKPEYVIKNFATYLAIKDPNKYPDKIAERNKKKAERAYAILLYKLRTSEKGILKAKIFKKLFVPFHELAGVREYPKFSIIKILHLVRSNYTKIAEELVKRNQLSNNLDIFYLKLDEITNAVNNPAEQYLTVVEKRRKSFEKEMNRKEIPRVILSDGTIYYEVPELVGKKDKNIIYGSSASSGKVTGKVKIMMDPYSHTLEAGEILVCPGTDPSWTPLFQVAGGLITEVGGMMTHGSVVAREFGIPAVVGINRATSKFKTGQVIELNGTSGIVKIVEEK